MARKSTFSKDDILDAAFLIVRKKGFDALSPNSIADELKASTMPIYSHLKSMNSLKEKIIKKALDILIEYQKVRRTGDPFLDMGVGYILFAKEESHLYKCLNDNSFFELRKLHDVYNFDSLPDQLTNISIFTDITNEQRKNILFTMWVLFHGLAMLINNSIRCISEDEIVQFLQETGITLWQGYKQIVDAEKFEHNSFYAYEGIIRGVEAELRNYGSPQTALVGIKVNRVGVGPYEGIFIK